MVSITVKWDSAGRVRGFHCEGHAEYCAVKTGAAGSDGDIVCAAISALTHTTVLALERLAGLTLQIKQDQAEGLLDCSWEREPEFTGKPELLIRAMIIGLTEIQRIYPDCLSLKEVEV